MIGRFDRFLMRRRYRRGQTFEERVILFDECKRSDERESQYPRTGIDGCVDVIQMFLYFLNC